VLDERSSIHVNRTSSLIWHTAAPAAYEMLFCVDLLNAVLRNVTIIRADKKGGDAKRSSPFGCGGDEPHPWNGGGLKLLF
jgi:hypothetical protein